MVTSYSISLAVDPYCLKLGSTHAITCLEWGFIMNRAAELCWPRCLNISGRAGSPVWVILLLVTRTVLSITQPRHSEGLAACCLCGCTSPLSSPVTAPRQQSVKPVAVAGQVQAGSFLCPGGLPLAYDTCPATETRSSVGQVGSLSAIWWYRVAPWRRQRRSVHSAQWVAITAVAIRVVFFIPFWNHNLQSRSHPLIIKLA